MLFIPLIIYQNLILPVYILPSAQALGIWGRVTQFFNLAWLFFDMGTSIAFIKYLSQYRVHDPRKGIQYGQVFVWWQALSGAIQVALVVALAGTVAPKSAYALYAWSVIIHAFIQIPGFYQVMRHALTGFQRLDYARFLDMGLNLVFPMLVQPVFVSLTYAWGKANPQFGGAMGGLLGLGIAAYAAGAAHLPAWAAGCTAGWATTPECSSWRISTGRSSRPASSSASSRCSARWPGRRAGGGDLDHPGAADQLRRDLGQLGAGAEFHLRLQCHPDAQRWHHARHLGGHLARQEDPQPVLQRDAVQMERADQRLPRRGAAGGGRPLHPGRIGPGIRARRPLRHPADHLGRDPVSLLGGRQRPAGLQQALPEVAAGVQRAGHPRRAGLLLLERFQINALIIAYFVGLFSKGIVAYFINHQLCYPQRFYFWQSLVAPLLAAAVHFALLRWLTGLIWQGDQITSVLIFFIGILPSFPLYMFFYGLFGGWDTDTLEELHQAVALTGFVRPLAWLIWKATALGARLSPLHNRFPISIRPAAMQEAQELTAEKVESVSRTLHVISHTHWDREWYLTFQQFRLKLVHLMDGLLELLETDPEYQVFHARRADHRPGRLPAHAPGAGGQSCAGTCRAGVS